MTDRAEQVVDDRSGDVTIEAVLFDFGGVITTDLKDAFAKLAGSAGADPRELVEFLLGDYHGDDGLDSAWHRFERGEITLAELDAWGQAEGERRGWQLRLNGLVELIDDLPVRPGVVDYIRQLRQRGLRIGLVTNNAREFSEIWRSKLPVGELFDVVIDSCEVGVRKPDPAIYRLALEGLGGIAPEHAVLLDDIAGNVGSAKRMGLHAVHVGKNLEPAIDELEALLAGTE